MSAAVVRPVRDGDAPAIQAIYAPYVADTAISLEDVPPGVDEMAARIAGRKPGYPYLVAERDGRVVGYAYAAAFHPRSAYRFTAEVTVYCDRTVQRRGTGRQLYGAVLDALRHSGHHRAVALITLPNDASCGLHAAFGFRQAGVLTEAGWKFGRWHDVGYWECALNGAKGG